MSYLSHDEASLRAAAEAAVTRGRATGAQVSAVAEAGGGAEVVVRDGDADIAQRDGYQSLYVTVIRDGRTGSASTASLEPEAIARVVDEAAAIAAAVEPGEDVGLADPAWLAMTGEDPDLFSPDLAGVSGLRAGALAIEAAAIGDGRRVTGAGATSRDGLWVLATSTGFCRGSAHSIHERWCSVLAEDERGAVQDFHSSSDRRVAGLDAPETVARIAVVRAMAARGARAIASRTAPVLFEPRVAATLVMELMGALSGGAQMTGRTFLPDSLGRTIAADHLDLVEDPFEAWGLASRPFDGEGVAGFRRSIVAGGEARGLFLATRSARRLGMRSTGNANGPCNLRLTGGAAEDRAALLRRMGSGLIVSELLGGATDPVRGTWTRAVAGFRVEDGAIVHAVRDVTLAGSMPTMLRDIVSVGGDVERHGAVRTGSILIDAMQVGGAA